MLIIHLVLALSSLVLSALSLFRPSKQRLNASFVLIGLTFTSGTALVVQTHAALLSACISGITYLAIAVGLTLAGARKLAREQA
ncbi:hypothetical protein BH10PAT3_BH10PAT3_5700 [soil metagenome]